MSKEKLQYTVNNYFCASSIRPDCLRGKSLNGNNEMCNLCCLYCDMINKCIDQNKSKTKPCSAKIVSPDEHCPYSI